MSRGIAALVAFAWAMGPLLALAHEGEAPHRYCREHGALEEGSAPSAPGARLPDDGVAVAADAEADEAHEACLSSVALPRAVTCAPPAVTGACEAPTGDLPAPPHRDAVPASALWILAPKTSPPAAPPSV
jgi:hypothetical protein